MMHNMLTHTPGPWNVVEAYEGILRIYSANTNERRGVPIATLNADSREGVHALANARLMAAAPELLDALVRLYQVSTYASLDNVLLSYVRHAIAKARGES